MTEEKMSLEVFSPIRKMLAELQKKDSALVFDITTKGGEKDLRSWVQRVRGYKSDIAKTHKEVKSEALAFGRKVDAIKNELTEGANKIITERMKPLDELEAKRLADAEAIVEAERVEKERIEQERLDAIAEREAEATKREADLKAKEDAAAESERKQKAELDAHQAKLDAKEATLHAKIDAEADAKKRETKARKDAEEKAEREKAEAVEAEREKARRLEDTRLAEEKAEKVKTARLAQIEADRVADIEHQKTVHQGIIDSILIVTGATDEGFARDIVDAIVRGEIRNVTINY